MNTPDYEKAKIEKHLSDNVDNSEQNAGPKFKKGDLLRVISTDKYGHIGQITEVEFEHGNIYYQVLGAEGWHFLEKNLEPYTEPEEKVAKMKPIESKVSVYLAKKKEDEEFRKLLHENGFMWSCGNSLISQSNWASDPKDYQMHFVYPDKTVTYSGERTEDTLTFTEFKKRYFDEDVNLSQNPANCDKHFDNILEDSFSKERRLNIAAKIMSGMMSNQIMLRNLIQGEATPEGAVKCIVNATMMYADALIAECGFSTRPQGSSEKGDTNV